MGAPDKSGDLSLDSDSYLPASWAQRRPAREEIEEDEYVTASHPRLRPREEGSSGRDSDPYYSGYSARVPTFVGEQRRERASRRDERRYDSRGQDTSYTRNQEPLYSRGQEA